MRYFFSVLHDGPGLATAEEMTAIDAFNERLQDLGYWVLAGGLGAPDTGTVIDSRSGAAHVARRSGTGEAEFVSGFWILDIPAEDEAVALAAEGSRACQRKIEVRPFL